MRRTLMPYALILILLSALACPGRAEEPEALAPVIDLSAIDRGADPCQDFVRYACGKWSDANPIPADRSVWSRFSLLDETNRARLHALLDAAAADPKGERQRIGGMYKACMDEAAIERKDLAPLKPLLDRIAALDGPKTLPRLIAQLHRDGIGVLFDVGAEQDFGDATRFIPEIDQGGLGLPERGYYTRDDQDSAALRQAYQQHVAAMLALAGAPKEQADKDAAAILAFETELARGSLDVVRRRDPNNEDHRDKRAAVLGSMKGFSLAAYAEALPLPASDIVNVGWPDFFAKLDATLATTELPTLKAYLRWHTLHALARQLPKRFVDENFAFYGKRLSGQPEQEVRWKRCTTLVDTWIGEDLGRQYVAHYFPAAAKARTLAMIKSIEAAFADDIGTLDWMSAKTKAEARNKLNAIANKIGYPDKWRDYSRLTIKPDDALGNLIRANTFEFQRDLNKIGRPVDRGEWHMTPPTVNAYYSGQHNDINFPAGALQPSFFDAEGDDAGNYGAIGVIMGHEMTHGFDDSGRKFDRLGNLKDWWSKDDAAKFESKAQCLVDEYSGFRVADDLNVNGKLTLGENTADNGGLRLAYAALAKILAAGGAPEAIDGFTPQQRFFLAFGQSWCANVRPEEARRRALTDPHAPPADRVNGSVRNFEAFGQAFSCKPGDPMMPQAMCRVW